MPDDNAQTLTERANIRGLIQRALEAYDEAFRSNSILQCSRSIITLGQYLSSLRDETFKAEWRELRGGRFAQALEDPFEYEVTFGELGRAKEMYNDLLTRFGMGLQQEGVDVLAVREQAFKDRLRRRAWPVKYDAGPPVHVDEAGQVLQPEDIA